MPQPNFQVDDIAAAVILSTAMFRRLDALRSEASQFPKATTEAVVAWREAAVKAYTLMAASCFIKIILNQLWFRVLRPDELPLRIGGLVIFASWIVACVIAWRLSTEARALRAGLGPQALRQRP